MTILLFSDISWEGLYQRPHHLAVRFAEESKVLWIEPVVLSKRPRLRPVRIRKNLYALSLPIFPYNARQKWIRILASMLSTIPAVRMLLGWLQVSILRRALAQLAVDEKDLVFFFENIHSIHILDAFTPLCACFDYIDNAFGFVELPHHVRANWEYGIRRADIMFVTSATLRMQVEKYGPKDLHLVSNGVEYDFFSIVSQLPRPNDVPAAKPVIGYIGAVYPWFDFGLIGRLCEELPMMNIVIIGRAHPEVAPMIEKLRVHPNFYFLGFREYAAIPAYVQIFSIGIIPFQKNELTEGVNPVKLYEYCAAGVPVIATDFSPDLYSFRPYVTIVRSQEECLDAIPRVLEKKNDEKFIRELQTFASKNDWAGKAASILLLIKKHIHQEKS